MASDPGMFGDRHVIGPGTEILNGVFFGNGAIVVDYKEAPDSYEAGAAELAGLLDGLDAPSAIDVGLALHEVVRSRLPSDEGNEGRVLRSEADRRGLEYIGTEDEVGLSLFMDGGKCHHQALFGGALVRLLQQRRMLEGKVSMGAVPATRFRSVRTRHTWLWYEQAEQGVRIDASNPYEDVAVKVVPGFQNRQWPKVPW